MALQIGIPTVANAATYPWIIPGRGFRPQACSGCFWFMESAQPAAATYFVLLGLGFTDGPELLIDRTTGVNVLDFTSQAQADSDGTTVILANTWYHVGFTITSATAGQVFLNGVLELTTATLVAISGMASLTLGRRLKTTASVNDLPGWIAGLKLWSGATLTANDFLLEKNSLRPVTNLPSVYGWWPLDCDLFDASGNGQHLWPVGKVACASGPPMTDLNGVPERVQLASLAPGSRRRGQ